MRGEWGDDMMNERRMSWHAYYVHSSPSVNDERQSIRRALHIRRRDLTHLSGRGGEIEVT